MTPGQARFALSSFLLVAIGVVSNALFLQTKPVAAARAADRAAPPVTGTLRAGVEREAGGPQAAGGSSAAHLPLRIARYSTDTSKLASPPDSFQEAGPETVRAIQRELRLRGYGALPGDGTLGLATRAAIIAYEHDQGLAPSGMASERLLRHILFGVSGGEAATAGAGKPSHAEQVTRAVQQWLAALGYQPGRIDGMLGDATVQAIRDFEVDKGLVPRGRITADLVTRLSEAATPKAQGR
jgi:hypothetical protein